MLTLYGHVNRLSINSFKLRVALAEADAAYQYVPVDLAAGANRSASFLGLNPHGKIPVLADDDFVLPESDAILWYIAESFPSAGILATTPRERARTLQWIDFASTSLYPGYLDVYVHAVVSPPEKRLPALAESGRQKLTRALAVMEEVLGTRPYLSGEYSIADISAATIMRTIQERLPADLRRAESGNIGAWFTRVTDRTAWQSCLAPQSAVIQPPPRTSSPS
jgi:glutathione S-transferase